MKKKSQNQILPQFREHFINIAEEQLGISRHERGFLKEIKKSLRLPQLSTPQRWVEGTSMMRIGHLLTIHKYWRVTPNDLLGIEDRPPEKRKNAKGK